MQKPKTTKNTNPEHIEIRKKSLIKTFSRVGGRGISDFKNELLETFLPTISVDANLKNITAKNLFPQSKELWFEIGIGRGEHLVAQAQANPQVGLIGCEVYLRALANCVHKIYDDKISNIKLFQQDARELLLNFSDEQIDRIFILFPDPWPKAKHAKRRMINPESLEIFYRVLKTGGKIRVATDHSIYKEHTLEVFENFKKFTPVFKSVDELTIEPQDHFKTRYQTKNMAKAQKPFFMDFIK
jgi:tRNA (guanine-N7-)-methyltransferase